MNEGACPINSRPPTTAIHNQACLSLEEICTDEATASDYMRQVRAARTIVLPLAIAIIAVALAIDVLYSTVPLGVDFHTYEAAAQVGLRQGWVHIYDQALVADEQRRLVPDQLTQAF